MEYHFSPSHKSSSPLNPTRTASTLLEPYRFCTRCGYFSVLRFGTMLATSSSPGRNAPHALLRKESERPLLGSFVWLPLVDEFRTANWSCIKRELQFSGLFQMFPALTSGLNDLFAEDNLLFTNSELLCKPCSSVRLASQCVYKAIL